MPLPICSGSSLLRSSRSYKSIARRVNGAISLCGIGVHLQLIVSYGKKSGTDTVLINAHRCGRRESPVRPNPAHPIPRIPVRRALTFGFIAFLETGYEELFGQRCKHHAARLAIPYYLVGVI